MEKKFLEHIRKNKLLKKGDRVIVACSGGADSVALLTLLNKTRTELGVSLIVVHVNHNIRGKEAKRDENHVRSLAEKFGLECVIKSVDAPSFAKESKKTLEQSARELRYQALREAKEEKGAVKIAVAHNMGDQAESVLMHLFRGSGSSGVAGMTPKNNDIIRPLLDFDKKELIEYLVNNNIKYVEDGTNIDINYSRNFIRHRIIAEAEKIYPATNANIGRFAKKMQQVEDYIGSMIPNNLIVKRGRGVVILNDAKKGHDVILTRLIFMALDLINLRVDIEEKHINQIIALFGVQVGKKIDLPNNLVATKVHEGIYLCNKEDDVFYQSPFREIDVIKTEIGEICITREDKPNFGDNGLYIDAGLVSEQAVWRKIKNGDKFTKFSGGTKLLSKFLTDKKIDALMRKKMVVLAVDDNILVVPGVEISKNVKITSKTKKIVKISFMWEQGIK